MHASQLHKCTHLLLAIVAICSSSTSVLSQLMNEDAGRCAPHHQPVLLPINIHLLFAGTIPLFMRNSSWSPSHERTFINQLHATVRHRAMHFEQDSLLDSPLLRKTHPQTLPCSVIEYPYTYQLSTITDSSTLSSLDHVISSSLNDSASIFIDSNYVADSFAQVLSEHKSFNTVHNIHRGVPTYYFLIYNTVAVAPQYAYRVEKSGPVTTIGLASSQRFAFLDIGARPFMFETLSQFMPGEILMSVSRSSVDYAESLHSIVTNVFTPPVSSNMRQYPHETRFAFNLNLVDVTTVIPSNYHSSKEKLRALPIALSFNTSQFITFLRSVFNHLDNHKKVLTLSSNNTNMNEDAAMAMTITRALSNRNIHVVLDKEQIFKDVILQRSQRSAFYVDSSSVVHIPLFLFSFVDDARTVHFQDSEKARIAIVNKEAVLIIENRAQQEPGDDLSFTSDVASHVLQLFFGIGQHATVHLKASSGMVPLIVLEQIGRNLLVQKVDWSEKAAASKAQQLLNFEGLDSRLIPHEQGSSIEQSRNEVGKKLHQLYDVWSRALPSVLSNSVDVATVDLVKACEQLASKLHEEICNQRLPEEILLKAEAEVAEDAKVKSESSSFLTVIILPAILGISLMLVIHQMTNPSKTSSNLRDGSTPNMFLSEAQNTTTQWFSTLHPLEDASKPKTS